MPESTEKMDAEQVNDIEQPRRIQLALFISRNSVASHAAVKNIRRALEKHALRFDLEIVDVSSDPQRLLRERILVTPMLIAQPSGRRIVGELNDAILLEFFLQSFLEEPRG